MDTATALAADYFCPMCGIPLERFDFDKGPEGYSCPYCCSQQRPSRVPGRAGWEYPD
jgi:hypothetical protein